jgi:hypothetical protein
MATDWDAVARRNLNPAPSIPMSKGANSPGSGTNWDEVAKRNVKAAPEKGLLERAWDWEKEQVAGAVEAGKKLTENVGKGNVFTDENAKLAAEVANRGTAAALPALPVALGVGAATAGVVPTLMTAGLASGLGMVSGAGARKGAEWAGAGPGVQDLAEVVGGAVGGSAGMVRGINRVAAARAAAKASQGAKVPVTPKGQAEAAVKGRTEAIAEGADLLKQRGVMSRAKEEGWDALVSKVFNTEAPAISRLKKMARKNGLSRQEADEFMKEVENLTAVSRRPDAPQVELVERLGFEDEVRKAAPKVSGKEVPSDKIMDAYMVAKRENMLVQQGRIKAEDLKGGAARVVENQKILDAYRADLEPLAQTVDKMGKEVLSYLVKTGIKSPEEAAKLAATPFWVPFQKVRTAAERSAADLRRGAEAKRVMGKGDVELVDYLADDLSRETFSPIQGMLDYAQNAYRQGAKNAALVKVAENANWMGAERQIEKRGMGIFKDVLILPGTERAYNKLPEQMRATTGKVPVWIGGKEHQMVADPALIKAVENWGSISLDVANPYLGTVQSLLRGASRVFKGATTGWAAPQRKLVNTAYNYMQLWQQLPAEVTAKSIGDSVKFAWQFAAKDIPGLNKLTGNMTEFNRLRTEGLQQSAFGSSSEIIRGVGEKNIGLLAAKANPLKDLPRYAILDPVKEVGKWAKGEKYNPEIAKQFTAALDDTTRKMEDLLTADETGFRMAVYKQVEKYYLKKGYAPEKAKEMAAYDARNVITDFSKRGTWAKYYDFVGLQYAQAAATGMATNIQYAMRDPVGFAWRSMVPWLSHVMINQAQFADPEKRKILMDIPPDTLARNLIIVPDPSKVKQNESGRYTEGIYVVPQPESSISRVMNLMNIGVIQNKTEQENAVDFMSLVALSMRHLMPVDPNPLVWASNIPLVGPMGELALGQSVKGYNIFSEKARKNVDKELPTFVKRGLDAAGANKETKIGANYLLQRTLPVLRAYNLSSPQGGDGELDSFEGLVNTLLMPVTSAPGGELKRKAREKKNDLRLNR